MTEGQGPPTARERALFEAATKASPETFISLCKVIGRDPRHVLDGYDAEPWRWLIVSFASPGAVSEGTRALQFPSAVRARLDATRRYVEASWWQRKFGRNHR
jgi:hypothetical protein